MKSDIEIAQAAKLEKIGDIAAKLDIPEESLEPFGHYKAKISLEYLNSIESKTEKPSQSMIEIFIVLGFKRQLTGLKSIT